MRRFLLACAMILAVLSASAQEHLGTILDRGHVREWLVCGPFVPDVSGGIIEALGRGEAPLADRDFMAPLGGVSRLTPSAGDSVPTDGGNAVWERVSAHGSLLDMGGFFVGWPEGVAYAAFSCQSPDSRQVYFDLQTPLGARMWVNGFPMAEVRTGPLETLGVDRFVVRLRAGDNRVIIQVPGATLGGLADYGGLAASRLREIGFPNRPLLAGESGYQLSLRVLPVERFGEMFYVPRLARTRLFQSGGDTLSQAALLTLFNPGPEAGPPVTVTTFVAGVGKGPEQLVSPVGPRSQTEAVLTLPVGSAMPGQPLRVEVTMLARAEKLTFTTGLSVGQPPPTGTVHVLTGAGLHAPGSPEDQRTRTGRVLGEIERHAALSLTEPGYGFYLGHAEDWHSFLLLHPDRLRDLRDLVSDGRVAPDAAWGSVDHRLVSGELLARNLALGRAGAEAFLGRDPVVPYGFGQVAMAPQWPQMLAQVRRGGTVLDAPSTGMPALYSALAPDGSRASVRRKQPAPGAISVEQLQDAVDTQRRELIELGVLHDLLPHRSLTPPPEPFWPRAARTLRAGIPSVNVSGGGGVAFFDHVAEEMARGSARLPQASRLHTAADPGSVIAQPYLKQAHARAEALLSTAETFAALAAALGRPYPDTALDAAWRSLIHAAHPDRLGFAANERNYVDALASCARAAASARDVLDATLSDLAGLVDTRQGPGGSTAGSLAVVVFNPSAWERTDTCRVVVPAVPQAGFSLVDAGGEAVPHMILGRPSLAGVNATDTVVQFIATAIPALGHKTYYLLPGGDAPASVQIPEATGIENAFLRLRVDPGAGGGVVSLVDKATGREFAASILNDVVAAAESSDRTGRGRFLWTTGEVGRASSATATVVVNQSPAAQWLTATVPFEGGTLVRELWLHQGVPRVDCVTRFEGISDSSKVLAATFSCFSLGASPVLGERFAAVTGRRSPRTLDFRSDRAENPSATAVLPALRWAALTPSDHLRFSGDIQVPLVSTAIVVDGAGAALPAASILQEALTRRGIPCDVYPDKGFAPNPVWSDATLFRDIQEDLRYGAGMRVVLGTGDVNTLAKRLFAKLSEEQVRDFNNRLDRGAAVYLLDDDVPDGVRPVPTLVLAASSEAVLADYIRGLADALRSGGVITLPATAHAAPGGAPLAESGLALLHPGSALHSISADNVMLMALAHGSRPEPVDDDFLMVGTEEELEFRYAIYPFEGDWRTAGVPYRAQEYERPLHAVVTGRHAGLLPAVRPMLDSGQTGFLVETVKAEGYPVARMTARDQAANPGITLRGHEVTGMAWRGDLAVNPPAARAFSRDLMESTARPLDLAAGGIPLAVSGFGIETVTVELSKAAVSAEPPVFAGATPEPASAVHHTRHWLHNDGAAPGGMQPVGLLLDGDLAGTSGNVGVTVANHRADVPVEGRVLLIAPAGWTVTPDQFSYYLRPGETVREAVMVLGAGGPGVSGGVVAETTWQGMTFRDVLHKALPPMDMSVAADEAGIIVTVRNPDTIPLRGHVDLVCPPEHWAILPGNGTRVMETGPRPVSVGPGGEQRILYRKEGVTPSQVIARLAGNGRVLYRQLGTYFESTEALPPPPPTRSEARMAGDQEGG